MRKVTLSVLSVAMFLTIHLSAQVNSSAIGPKLDDQATAALVRVGGQLLIAGKAYEYDRVLADEIGPRITGSSGYVKAVDWVYSEFERLGLTNVRRESWNIVAAWEPETNASAQILVPRRQRLHLESDGWSPSTPSGGIRGKIHHLSALDPDAIRAEAADIKEAIVLIDEDTLNALKTFTYGKIQDAISLITSEGARALLLGLGQTNNAPAMFGSGLFGSASFTGSLEPLPTGSIGKEDTLLLRRMLDRGPVEVEFSFTNRIREHVKVDNIVGEIPGSDPTAGYVLIAGHLDGWHLGTGAQDDGTGAATVLAIADAVKAAGIQTKRTLRFVLFGGEELGLMGSIAYVRTHVAELDKCAAVFVTDSGSGAPKGWYVFGRDDQKNALAAIKSQLDSLGAGKTTDEGWVTFETDGAAFIVHGVPTFLLWTPLDKYFPIHHVSGDTFDKVNQRDLNLGAAVVGMTALAFADTSLSLKHLTSSEFEEQLKRIDRLEAYQDMQAHHMF